MCVDVLCVESKNEEMSDAITRKIGQAIRKKRLKLDISQEELAERADVHRNYIGLVERGERTPTVRNLVKLARGLGMKASKLLDLASL